MYKWESTETLQTNTIGTRSDCGSQAFEAPCEKKRGRVSEYVKARESIGAYREGNTETLSTFPSPFNFFRVRGLFWCSPLPSRFIFAFLRYV